AETAYRRANHCDPEGARGRGEDGRSVPQTRNQRSKLLQLEGQVRWSGSIGSQAAARAGERERQAEEAVAHLRSAFDMSERRACRTINCVRMTMRYRSRRPDDAELRQRLRALAHERRRFGYRRLHVLLRREGFTVNHKRLFRLYREERLTVRR